MTVREFAYSEVNCSVHFSTNNEVRHLLETSARGVNFMSVEFESNLTYLVHIEILLFDEQNNLNDVIIKSYKIINSK